MSPPAAQAIQVQKYSPRVSVGKTYVAGTYYFHFFLNEATAGTPGMSVKPFTQTFQDLTCQNVKYEVLLSMWNITQKLHPGLKPSNHKQLRKRHMCSAPKRNVHAVSKRYTLKFCAQLLHVHPETWLPRGLSFFFPLNIFGYTYSTYVYVHKCLVNSFIYLFILRLCSWLSFCLYFSLSGIRAYVYCACHGPVHNEYWHGIVLLTTAVYTVAACVVVLWPQSLYL